MAVTSATITAPASLRSDRDRLRVGITDRLQFGITDRLRRNTHGCYIPAYAIVRASLATTVELFGQVMFLSKGSAQNRSSFHPYGENLFDAMNMHLGVAVRHRIDDEDHVVTVVVGTTCCCLDAGKFPTPQWSVIFP